MGRALLVSAILGGCAVAPHTAPTPKDAATPEVELVKPFGIPGEAMEYAAALRGLPVGRLITAVGKIGWIDGHRALIVKSRGQSTGMIALLADLTWEQTSTIDLDRGHVITSHEESWASIAGEKEHEDREIGDEGLHDVHSATAAVRNWRSLPGQHASVDVNFGHHTLHAQLRDAGHGFLASAGEPAVRYEGVIDEDEEIHFTAWVSDDIARVPLRFECSIPMFGQLVIELAHYTAPAE